MGDAGLTAALKKIDLKNRRFEESFKAGDMATVAKDFYTEDARYLTGQLSLLRGRDKIAEFFHSIHSRIEAVYIYPIESFGDPDRNGVIYQMCNTIQHLATGERGYGHYVATFRLRDGEWFCEMEVPAMGWIEGGQPVD